MNGLNNQQDQAISSGEGANRAPQTFRDIAWNAPNPPPKAAPARQGTPNAVTGTALRATIVTESWDTPGKEETLVCGSFEVVGVKLTGPPSTFQIEAVSVPLNAPIRQVRTKGWEDTTLRRIANDVCSNGGFSLVYELDNDPVLDRVDQRQESDLKFLKDLCKQHGASVKVTGNQLVIFDEKKYEARDEVLTIKKGDGRLLSYSFTLDSTTTASSATVMYKDPKSGQFCREEFAPPMPPATATALIINARLRNMQGDRYRRMAMGALEF